MAFTCIDPEMVKVIGRDRFETLDEFRAASGLTGMYDLREHPQYRPDFFDNRDPVRPKPLLVYEVATEEEAMRLAFNHYRNFDLPTLRIGWLPDGTWFVAQWGSVPGMVKDLTGSHWISRIVYHRDKFADFVENGSEFDQINRGLGIR